MSTPGVLVIPALLPAVPALGETHGQRGSLVLLQVDGGELEGHEVHVGHPGAPLPLRPVTHAEHVGKREVHNGFTGSGGSQDGPVSLVDKVSGIPWVKKILKICQNEFI